MSAPNRLHALLSPEPLPPRFAASEYTAFRGVLPGLTIVGTVQSLTLTPDGKLAITIAPNEQIDVIPKKDATDRSESHIVLAPGGSISPELIARP
jgi:hypothetical protein